MASTNAAIRRRRVPRLRVRSSWERQRGKGRCHCARLTIPLRDGGSLTLRALVSEQEVRDRIRAACRAQGVSPEAVGGLFGSIGKAIGSVAKSSSLAKVASLAHTVSQSPIGAALIPPQVQAAIGVANIAGKLVMKARAGNPDAQAIVQHAQAAAARPAVYTAPILSRTHQTVRAVPTRPTTATPLPGAPRDLNATFRYLLTLSRAD